MENNVTNPEERKPGYYWIKGHTEPSDWEIAEYRRSGWHVWGMGKVLDVKLLEMAEIDERIITRSAEPTEAVTYAYSQDGKLIGYFKVKDADKNSGHHSNYNKEQQELIKDFVKHLGMEPKDSFFKD